MPDTSDYADPGQSRHLVAVPAQQPVLEGEVIPPPRSVPLRVVRAAAVAARHDRTRAVARNVSYIALGAAVVIRRLWMSRTAARYERHLRSAEKSGDLPAALEWESRLAAFRRERHQRRMELIELPARAAERVPRIQCGFLLGLAVTGRRPARAPLPTPNPPARQRHSRRAQKARPKFPHATATKTTVTGKPQVQVFATGFS